MVTCEVVVITSLLSLFPTDEIMYGDVLNGYEIFNLVSCGFSHDTLKFPSDPFISPEILFIINIFKCLKLKINFNSYCMEVILKKKKLNNM